MKTCFRTLSIWSHNRKITLFVIPLYQQILHLLRFKNATKYWQTMNIKSLCYNVHFFNYLKVKTFVGVRIKRVIQNDLNILKNFFFREYLKVLQRNFRQFLKLRYWSWFSIIQKTRWQSHSIKLKPKTNRFILFSQQTKCWFICAFLVIFRVDLECLLYTYVLIEYVRWNKMTKQFFSNADYLFNSIYSILKLFRPIRIFRTSWQLIVPFSSLW